MFWADAIVTNLVGTQIINDSKTLSGRAHVGALRGVLLHDIIYRAARSKGLDVEFLYGSDDYDALDTVPPYLSSKQYSQYLGWPLCNIPAPDGSEKSYSDFFLLEFSGAFNELGAFPRIYRMSELYKSGQLNQQIQLTLENAAKIREIYFETNKSEKTSDWLPFSVICENCGKIATTRAYLFDGEYVHYVCEPQQTYTEGCGYRGRVSPYNGTGKLPWKVEWAARWVPLNVTIEGAGIDHSVAGGSRDVAESISREVFLRTPPVNLPYEFLLFESRKMSSSKGVGLSAKDVVDILPPEILRFLLTRTRPQRHIDFRLDGDTVPSLFDEYDRYAESYFEPEQYGEDAPMMRRIFELSQTTTNLLLEKRYHPRFSYVATLIQTPGVNIKKKIEEAKGAVLTPGDEDELTRRTRYAKIWLDNFAPESYKFEVAEKVPDSVQKFSDTQITFLETIAEWLSNTPNLSAEQIHFQIHEYAKKMELKTSEAFESIYVALLDRRSGPRVGSLIAALAREFVIRRFRGIKMSRFLLSAPFRVIERRQDASYRDLFRIHDDVLVRFPDLRIGVAVIRGVQVHKAGNDLEALKERVISELLQKYSKITLGSVDRIQAYRKIYRGFGIDPGSRNPSAEALIRRIIRDGKLYNINNIVDAYNLTSAEVAIPMAAYDYATLKLPIELRFARQGELHYPIGRDEPTYLEHGELVYADHENIICQDFNYRDSKITMVTEKTKDLVIFVDGCGAIPHEDVQSALETVIGRVIDSSGGKLDCQAYIYQE